MTETGLPAESQFVPAQGSQAAPNSPPRRTDRMDAVMTVVISIFATGLIVLGIWWGYSAWASSQQQNLSTPAGRAIMALQQRVAQTPRDTALRIRLAEALGTANRTDEGIQQLKEALNIDGKHTGAWLDMGLLLVDKQDWTGAAAAFQKVVSLTEGSDMQDVNQRREQAFFWLAKLSLADKKYDDAARYIKAALRIRRDASDSYVILAEAYRGQGDKASAIKDLRIALAFDPTFAQANFDLGLLLKDSTALSDQLAGAQRLRVAADAQPDAEPPATALKQMGPASKWVTGAQQAIAAGDAKSALLKIQIALAIEPGNVPAAVAYAGLLEKSGVKGDKAKALQAYKQVLQSDPTNAAASAGVKRLSSK